MFRIVQESLTNVARHAQAQHVDITLRREGDNYLLEVRDDGNGFDTGMLKKKTFGLIGMKERVLMLRGDRYFQNSRRGDDGDGAHPRSQYMRKA